MICETCRRFKIVNKQGWGNCDLMPNYRLLSGLFECRHQPHQWVRK